MEKEYDSNLAKELFMVLSNADDDFLDRIPDYFFENLNYLAADSNKNFYLKNDKPLSEQEISEECKDCLSLLYYFIADSSNKENILNAWIKNDINNN